MTGIGFVMLMLSSVILWVDDRFEIKMPDWFVVSALMGFFLGLFVFVLGLITIMWYYL
jgi:cytochrome bd-type quinol oxidase subunit 1